MHKSLQTQFYTFCRTSEITSSSLLLTPCALDPSIHREGMPGHMRSEHAAVWWSVPAGNCWDVRRPLLLPQGLQWCVTDPAGWFPDVPGLRLPLRSHAQVRLLSPFLQITCFAPWVWSMNLSASFSVSQTGAGEGGRIKRCTEGPGQPGHLSHHLWSDGTETRWPYNRSPLPAAWLCSPTVLWERCVNHSNCSQLIIRFISCCHHFLGQSCLQLSSPWACLDTERVHLYYKVKWSNNIVEKYQALIIVL